MRTAAQISDDTSRLYGFNEILRIFKETGLLTIQKYFQDTSCSGHDFLSRTNVEPQSVPTKSSVCSQTLFAISVTEAALQVRQGRLKVMSALAKYS
jgi:hypothetical protein